ncbi:MAG: non-canonical purine NTP pyrophosphatase [Anaerolineae bacterium]|nr:non-canonical purine NTP pyrophosphatase [Anaerolineae bacterium]
MRPTILFATHNNAKRQLFEPLFAETGFACCTLNDCADGRQVIEDAPTAVENALKKARVYHGPDWPFVFADDAGVEIDALNGEPGVMARRWGGRFPDDIDDQTWLDYLLARMRGVPLERRTGRFVSGWALLTPDGREHTRRITLEFVVALEPQRPFTPGFPMSAILVGEPYYVGERRVQVKAEWEKWGALKAWKQFEKCSHD